jgi:DNA repair protein RadA/Sms
MAKVEKDPFRCSECGWTSQKWVGRCGECQAWGCVEEVAAPVEEVAAPAEEVVAPIEEAVAPSEEAATETPAE